MTATVFRKKNKTLADLAIEILEAERPMTLRQLYYRLISAGVMANRHAEYKRLGGVMTRLRESEEVSRDWIVDHVRTTLKPGSWTGLADFTDTVRRAYRKDFWASLDVAIDVFVEKDAIAGTIQPVTHEYDVPLRVCRGYASVSFAGEIADTWSRTKKPIHAYYLGDFDPSGFDIERDLRHKLEMYSERLHVTDPNLLDNGSFFWTRLAVRTEDFDEHQLIKLPVKHGDTRARGFTRTHGDACAEIDALPPTELRRRVREAIESHIDQERWKRLQATEEIERKSIAEVMDAWKKNEKPNLG